MHDFWVPIHSLFWQKPVMNNYSHISAKLAGKKILITGATGFVGKNLCETLVQLNSRENLKMEIVGISRRPVEMKGVTFISHDVCNPFTLEGHFDYIIHAATPVTNTTDNEEKILDIIVKGTKNILDFAGKCMASHFLLVSSGAVYGAIPESLSHIPENFRPVSPLTTAYARGKQISESMALDYQSKSNIILNIARCFAFSGRHLPLDGHFAIGNFVRDALIGQNIQVKGDGSAIRSYMDSEDMVYWLLCILLYDKSDIFNVGSDQGISIKDLAHEVASQVNDLSVNIEGKSSSEDKKNVYLPSIEKAGKILGLKLTESRESSIKKMMNFNRDTYERISR